MSSRKLNSFHGFTFIFALSLSLSGHNQYAVVIALPPFRYHIIYCRRFVKIYDFRDQVLYKG